MNIPDEVWDAAEDYLGSDRPITHAYQVIAEWARKEALREATDSVARLGYVVDMDLTAFPSHWAVDRQEALDAIRALAERE
jgi:hypothetical protein